MPKLFRARSLPGFSQEKAIKTLFTRSSHQSLRLLGLSILAIALMLADVHLPATAKLRQMLTVLVLPVQYAVDLPIAAAAWLHDNLSSRQQLKQENAHLRAEQLMLKARMQKLIALQKENKQLRNLLQSLPKAQEKFLVAQLLSVASEPFSQQIVLDKGFKQGVFVGQPVIDAEGLIGQVINVAPLTSRVLLLSDNQSAVPVQDTRSAVRGIVVGRGTVDALALINMPKTTAIKSGDQLVTSGLGQRFPEGFPVGIVSRVSSAPGDEFATIYVKPSAHLNRSRLVLLIWPGQVAADQREDNHV